MQTECHDVGITVKVYRTWMDNKQFPKSQDSYKTKLGTMVYSRERQIYEPKGDILERLTLAEEGWLDSQLQKFAAVWDLPLSLVETKVPAPAQSQLALF